jgi:hypothetical protein
MFFKLLLLLSLVCSMLYSSETVIAAKIIDKTVTELFPGKKTLKSWGSTPYHKDIISKATHLVETKTANEADFCLVGEKIPESIDKDRIIFTTDIDLFYDDKRVIGAFYWQKGRPNLIFLRKRLEAYNLPISSELQDYIEDEL